MPKDVSAAIAGCGGPVLLVDDRVDTGWTMTLAAAMVRHAGAPAVLPLVLATVS
jgi:ATP-dependent DNA helicase RecQ